MTKDDLTHGDVGMTSVTSLLSLAEVRDGHVMGRVTSTRLPFSRESVENEMWQNRLPFWRSVSVFQ